MGELTRYRARVILAASSVSALVSGATSPIFFEFQAEPVMNGLFIGFFAAFVIVAFRYRLLDWLAAKLAVWNVFLAGFAGYSLIIVGVAFVSFRVTRAERLFDPARIQPRAVRRRVGGSSCGGEACLLRAGGSPA